MLIAGCLGGGGSQVQALQGSMFAEFPCLSSDSFSILSTVPAGYEICLLSLPQCGTSI